MNTRRIRLAAELCLALALAAGAAAWVVTQGDRVLRAELVDRARGVARAINPVRVVGITGTAPDARRRDQRRLEGQLGAWCRATPGCRRLYLLAGGRAEGGGLVRLVDAGPATAATGAAGTRTEAATPPAPQRVLSERRTATEGPTPDDAGGQRVSVWVPLPRRDGGEAAAILGLDADAAGWAGAVAARAAPPLTWLALLTLVVTGGSLLRHRRAARDGAPRPGAGGQASAGRADTAWTALLGALLAVGAAWAVHRADTERHRQMFAGLAGAQATALAGQLRDIYGELDGLGQLFESSQQVEPDEFRTYLSTLQNPAVTAWGWAPAEPPADGAAGRAASAAPALPAGRSWPLVYAAPQGAIAAWLGRDLGAQPGVAPLLAAALESGLPTAGTGGLVPGADGTDLLVVRAVRASARGAGTLAGFVLAEVRLEALVGEAILRTAGNEPGLRLELLELTDDAPPRAVVTLGDGAGEAPALGDLPDDPPDDPPDAAAPSVALPIFALGRAWSLVVRPTPAWLAASRSWSGWLMLLAGLAVTAAVAARVRAGARRRADLEREVQRRTAELHASETLLRNAEEVARLGSWELWLANRRLLWSDEVYRIFGVPRDDRAPLYDRFSDAVHPDDRRRVEEAYEQSLEDGSDSYEVEHRVVRPSGEVRWVHEKCTHQRDESGAVVRSLGMVQDVTDRRLADEERERLRAELFQAQKMESIGRLAGGVAHDFNNLLTGIAGNISLAQLEVGENDPAQPLLADALAAAERAAGVTKQLLAFSRRQVAQPRPVDLNALVARSRPVLARLIGEQVRFEFRPQDDLWPVRLDPVQLDQILINLLVNARDAMPQGGTLTVTTANVPAGGDAGDGGPDADRVLLSVSDDGPGMSAEVRERVFEPFFTTKEKGRGTGLGLSTVYGAVRQCGGTIDVESRPGEGSTFRIWLPRSDERAAATGETGARATAPRGSETVLLVEDDDLVRGLAARALTRQGYRTHAFPDGPSALAWLEATAETIDILVSDVVMPGMSGPDLAGRVRALRPGLPVLLTSGYADGVLPDPDALPAGAAFLAKPYSPQELATRVRQLLGARPAAAPPE
jgi:PAS domain S-box-containing protein